MMSARGRCVVLLCVSQWDVYGFGVLMWESLTSEKAFVDEDNKPIEREVVLYLHSQVHCQW
jgi:hypothetical protein